MNPGEYLVVVDENDNVVGKKLRKEISKQDIYRVSSLWIFDKSKRLLIAQRAEWKKHDPGKWTESAVGTVEYGETYESNLIKEAQEELGLKLSVSNMIFISKQYYKSVNGRMFGTMYAVILDKEMPKINYNLKEVPNIEWIKHEDIMSQLKDKNSRFVGGLSKFYNEVWDKITHQLLE